MELFSSLRLVDAFRNKNKQERNLVEILPHHQFRKLGFSNPNTAVSKRGQRVYLLIPYQHVFNIRLHYWATGGTKTKYRQSNFTDL